MPDSRPTPSSEPNERGPRSHNAGRRADGRDGGRRRGHKGRGQAGQEGRGRASRDNRDREGRRRPQREHARPFKPFTPEQLAERAAAIPVISFPDLPVSARRDEIASAIRDHQVVIVSGETGSGKTTQLPKICMQLGRGVAGMIGHTQPRRLAARSVADRIADELGQTVGRERGQVVGYQVRFTDEVGPTTLVKLMTDGILLAEIQSDPMLRRYDTLIIDEAHERSLNIDFILGYVARLLPARPDLKVIITSATIDSDRFARHFGTWEGAPGSGRLTEPAPVIEVSGRTYPVEIRYRPLGPTTPSSYTSEASAAQANDPTETVETTEVTESGPMQLVLEDPDDELATLGYGMGEDIDVETAICHAVDELSAEGDGDILVFLPGERDIRDTEAALLDHLKGRGRRAGDDKGARPGDIEILPLYARLTAAEQHRVFEPHRLRRVVLATNVAETSLTVPGIRYVIDPGLARISRYSNKTKVQRLPIEPVSQASANQRAGRCGRVAEGVAIRLFSQADYLSRPRFTEPEILRTSLASVILQMASLGLGAVEDFPFLDAPDRRAVRDGVALLVEIGALAQDREGADAAPASSQYRLTGIGRDLARLPIDPRLGRMLLEAERLGCASEVLVIVAALSIQDVRERPAEHQGTADASHARLADPHSDFITYLNLWRYLAVQARDLSGSAFRRMCRAEFFHYLRWREWRDVVGQLRQMARALGIGVGPVGEPSTGDVVEAAQFGGAQDAAVRAVLAYGQGTASVDADQVHRSLLVGLLSYLGSWDETKRDYEGARGTHFTIWPGSGVSGHPAWVMTAELVETSRLFARTVARIRPEWVEPAARGLLKRSYSEPFWSVAKGAAMVRERVTLYGLTLAADREVLLGRLGDLVIDEAVAASRSHAPRAGSLEALAAGLVSASKDPLSSGSFEPRHF
ncbi:MAG: ATP-dependent helicase, partial [Thermobifida sp.]|nr:ATP-dependent helicase [Thermobifida sp.]